MAEFPVNPTRFDPYKNYKFRVKWDGHYIPGISAVGPLRRTGPPRSVEHREGGDLSRFRRSPGLTRYDPITLHRGVTQDSAFEEWANLVWKLGAPLGGESALARVAEGCAYRAIERGRAGRPRLYRAPRLGSRVHRAPRARRRSRAVAIQSITLAHEGWERTPASPNRWNRRPIDSINSHVRELFFVTPEAI